MKWYNNFMKKIDVENINELDEMLNDIEDGDAVILSEGKEEKYAIISINDYCLFQELMELDRQINPFKYGQTEIRIVNDDNIEVSYEEYENIKKQLLEALDKTFKPKLEKLN